jgi:hypothetical protein
MRLKNVARHTNVEIALAIVGFELPQANVISALEWRATFLSLIIF